jgi:hypothetical protein
MSSKTKREATYTFLIYTNRSASSQQMSLHGVTPYAVVPVDTENVKIIPAEQYFKGKNGVGGWESWWDAHLIERSVATYGVSGPMHLAAPPSFSERRKRPEN